MKKYESQAQEEAVTLEYQQENANRRARGEPLIEKPNPSPEVLFLLPYL
jgi:hypothetical protein